MSLKIYYVDDEAALCENFAEYFESKEVAVTTFVDPLAAITSIKSNPPDLLFIDYRMPNITGDDVAKLVDPKIPMFLITGDITVETKHKFEKVFSKPYSEVDILKVISHYSETLKTK